MPVYTILFVSAGRPEDKWVHTEPKVKVFRFRWNYFAALGRVIGRIASRHLINNVVVQIGFGRSGRERFQFSGDSIFMRN